VAGAPTQGVERGLRVARFPYVKTLEQFDFSFQPAIDRKLICELAGPRVRRTRRELNPSRAAGGEVLFNLLAQRYERRSTIITSNLAFSEWVGDEKLTTALLDRLTHAHILTTRGDSYRSNKRKAEADNRAAPHQPQMITK
jgi:DNA replication protein DnaC